VFNEAAYYLYRSSSAPPAEDAAPFSVFTSLPRTPTTVFGNNTWWVALQYFNGVMFSGFLPIGPNGERFIRFVVTGGVQTKIPPNAPLDVRLEARAGGVIGVVAAYLQGDALRATEWAITYTTNGSTPGTPPAVSPTVTVAFATEHLAVLDYALPAQANGTTVKVRVQTRRDDSGTFVYSENSTVLTAVADTVGPAAPLVGEDWPGLLPEEF